VIAWQPPAGAQSFRLHSAPEGGLRVDNGAIAGGSAVPLARNAAGLPADVRAEFPQLVSYTALELSAEARALAPSLLTGELAVAAYDGAGTLLQTTGVQIPGVLDDLYASARDAEPGPVWRHGGHRHGDHDRRGGRPSLAVWAPTAKSVNVLVDPIGPRPERRVAMRRGDTACGA